MAEDLLDTIGQLFGPLRGGLAYAVIFVGALLAATTGVVAACVISMGLISLPIMLRYGYDRRLASGVIAASGTLAQIIPPSLVLIIMADQLGSSVGDMYAGAFIPGHHARRPLCAVRPRHRRSSSRTGHRRCRWKPGRCASRTARAGRGRCSCCRSVAVVAAVAFAKFDCSRTRRLDETHRDRHVRRHRCRVLRRSPQPRSQVRAAVEDRRARRRSC